MHALGSEVVHLCLCERALDPARHLSCAHHSDQHSASADENPSVTDLDTLALLVRDDLRDGRDTILVGRLGARLLWVGRVDVVGPRLSVARRSDSDERSVSQALVCAQMSEATYGAGMLAVGGRTFSCTPQPQRLA